MKPKKKPSHGSRTSISQTPQQRSLLELLVKHLSDKDGVTWNMNDVFNFAIAELANREGLKR